MAAVIFTRDTTLAQEFTSDKARLRAAVDKVTPGYAYATDRATADPGGAPTSGKGAVGLASTPSALKPPNPDEYWYKASVQVLANVAEDLIAIPQRRKVLVYIGIGVPFSVASAGSLTMGSGGDVEQRELMNGIREKLRARDQSRPARQCRGLWLRAGWAAWTRGLLHERHGAQRRHGATDEPIQTGRSGGRRRDGDASSRLRPDAG